MVRHKLKRLATLLMAAMPAFCQSGPFVSFDRDTSGCGDQRLESQLWLGLPGTVVSTTDAGRIAVRLAEAGTPVTVRLVGVSDPKRSDARAVRSFVLDKAGKHVVSIVLNPDDWAYRDTKPKEVLASITLEDGSDLGLLLIEKKLVHFRPPPPYKMSRYLACRYKLADQAAGAQRLQRPLDRSLSGSGR